MKFISLGGINEHGRNCFYIQGMEHSILLDCGRGNNEAFPSFDKIDVKNIDYLFISHSHLDHTGSIKRLVDLGFQGKIYLSEETYQCLSFKDFDHDFLPINGETKISDWLKIKSRRTGHCFGSLSFEIEFEHKKIFYSGDYLEDSVFKCDAIRNISADLAIIDGAYANNEKNTEENKTLLLSLIKKEKKVLLPLPKNGRSMDLISLLNENNISYKIEGQSFFKMNESEYLRKEVIIFNKEDSNVILFIDPQLASDVSKDIVNTHPDYSLIFTGTIDKGSYAEKLLGERKNTYFQRLNVHQREKDATRLASLNDFENVIIFHNPHTKEITELDF